MNNRHWDVRWMPRGFWQRFTVELAGRHNRHGWFCLVVAFGPVQIRWWRNPVNARRPAFRVVQPW